MSASQTHLTLPIPNGWFAVEWSRDLIAGEVKRIRYFDRELVLFRTRSGVPRVLDAYCPHLGAHIGEGGRVIGETVRCPFHGWRFDGDGSCVEIPYCKRIPTSARLQAWNVAERNRMIFVWHHAEGKPPSWDVPTMPELDDKEWSEPRFFDLRVAVHMQELAENNCDPVHFQIVHGSNEVPASEYTLAEDGRFFRIVSRGPQETPIGTIPVL